MPEIRPVFHHSGSNSDVSEAEAGALCLNRSRFQPAVAARRGQLFDRGEGTVCYVLVTDVLAMPSYDKLR